MQTLKKLLYKVNLSVHLIVLLPKNDRNYGAGESLNPIIIKNLD